MNGTVVFDAPVRATPRRFFVRASLLGYLSNAAALDFDPPGVVTF